MTDGVRKADIAILGGGIAGLAAAWSLRDRDVILLEGGARTGGRIESLSQNGYWVNFGAHLLGAADGPVARLAAELGVALAMPAGSAAAILMGGRIIRTRSRLALPFTLPLSVAARLSLVAVGLRLTRAFRKARRADPTDMVGALPAIDRWPADPTLDTMSFADVLGDMHPEVAALMRVITNRLATEPERLSGHIGATVAMSRWNKTKPVVVGGTARLTDALADKLGERILTGTRVVRVTQDAAAVRIETDQGAFRTITARECIVAVPAPAVRAIVADLPPAKAAALQEVNYGPFVVVGLFTNENVSMPWDDLYGIAVPGRSFCMMFNPANVMRGSGPRRPGGSLVLYAAGDRATGMMPLSDTEIVGRFVTDLEQLLPAARGIVSAAHVRRLPLGVPVPGPGRARLQRDLAASLGRIHFCGDYIAHPGTDSAVWTAEQAADRVRQRICQ